MTPRKTKAKVDDTGHISLKPDLGARLKQGVAILGFLFIAHFLIDLGVAVFVVWSLL